MDEHTRELLLEDDPYDHVSSSPSINEEEIDFQYVYALKTFIATEQGQANAYKGEAMILLNDANSYWWLVRMVKDSSVGFLPAEHIETPWERLARLNKYRNGEASSAQTHSAASKTLGKLFKSSSLRKKEKEKDREQRAALAAKTVSFTPQSTYISASEWDYSDNFDSDDDDLEDDGDSDEEDETDDVDQDTGADLHQPSLNPHHTISTAHNQTAPLDLSAAAAAAATTGPSSHGNSDDEGHLANNPGPLVIKKTRNANDAAPTGIAHLKYTAAQSSQAFSSHNTSQTYQSTDTPLASQVADQQIENHQATPEQQTSRSNTQAKDKQSVSQSNDRQSDPQSKDKPVAAPTNSRPKLQKKSSSLFSKIMGNRNASVGGEDLGTSIVSNKSEIATDSKEKQQEIPLTKEDPVSKNPPAKNVPGKDSPTVLSSGKPTSQPAAQQAMIAASVSQTPAFAVSKTQEKSTQRPQFHENRSSNTQKAQYLSKPGPSTTTKPLSTNVTRPMPDVSTSNELTSQNDATNKQAEENATTSANLSTTTADKQPKRRSFLKAKSSMEQFGKKDTKKMASLAAISSNGIADSVPPGRSRTVSVSSQSSAGSSASSSTSSFTKLFKRRKNKAISMVELGDLSQSSSPLSSPTSSKLSQELNMERNILGSGPSTSIMQQRIPMRSFSSHDGRYTTSGAESDATVTTRRAEVTEPLRINTKLRSGGFSGQQLSSQKPASHVFLQPRNKPAILRGPRPQSTPVDPRESDLGHGNPEASKWPMHASFHEDVLLDLPDTPTLVDNSSARTSIISENRISATSIAAIEEGSSDEDDILTESIATKPAEREVQEEEEEEASTSIVTHGNHKDSVASSTMSKDGFVSEVGQDTWKDGDNGRQTTENIALEREMSKKDSGPSTHSASGSISSPPTLDDQREDHSPVSEFSETKIASTNPVIKRFWNGSSTSSIGSNNYVSMESPSMITANTTNSESSVLSVTGDDSRTIIEEKIPPLRIGHMAPPHAGPPGSIDLHPDLMPIYENTTQRLGEIHSRLDALLSSYR